MYARLPRLVALAAVVHGAAAGHAVAAPGAEVVVFWSATDERAVLDRVRDTARAHGAAVVDRSPAPAEAPVAPAAIAAGIAAYDDLRFDDAAVAFDQAVEACDRTGADGVTREALADLFLYRGLGRIQRAQPGAWDELVTSARIDPARLLDPVRFPPRAIEQLTRARQAVAAAPRARLVVTGAEGCALRVDGAAADPAGTDVAQGDHWLRVVCPDRRPWGRRVTVDRDPTPVTATPAPITPPADDEALIAGRVAGATSVIDLRVAGGFARLRHVHVDGRELARVTLALAEVEPGPAIATELARLLAPSSGSRTRWYRSRWTWAAAGAALAAAVLVPFLIVDDDGPAPVVIRPTGLPPL